MHVFEEFLIALRILVLQLNKANLTMRLSSEMAISSSISKKAGYSIIMFQICSSLLKCGERGVIND